MKTKQIIPIFSAIFIIALAVSCTKSALTPAISPKGVITLKTKATINSKLLSKSAISAKTLNGLTISSFKINIKNIEFDRNKNDQSSNDSNLNEDSNLEHNDSTYTNADLKGPFELELALGKTSITVATTDIPKNVFDEIKFELHRSTNTQSSIFGKSIEIKGNISGIPFIFWTDVEEEMHVKFKASNTNIVVNSAANTATINFDLSKIFGAASTIDFSKVVDGNGNGIIEISPNNVDGNADLANLIKDLFEKGTNLEND